TRLIQKHTNNSKCLHFCIALASVLKGEFIDCANSIYQQCLGYINQIDFVYNEILDLLEI
ncbi:MAG: hypothetical protein K2H64_08760, partial [Desulfovibrio sp.]|nr:hypothetical protein [Desulfovibrio sp.]